MLIGDMTLFQAMHARFLFISFRFLNTLSVFCFHLKIKNRLELVLPKAVSGDSWAELVPGNNAGEQILDPELVDKIHSQLAHMCSDKWLSLRIGRHVSSIICSVIYSNYKPIQIFMCHVNKLGGRTAQFRCL